VRLRPANQDGAAGSLDEVKRLVAQIRRRWPTVNIVLRGDSGFCREELMAWCEGDENRVDYLFGLARNQRLTRIIGAQMHQARLLHQSTGKAARLFAEFSYQTKKSWARAPRGGQGRIPRQGRKPALRGHFLISRGVARAGFI